MCSEREAHVNLRLLHYIGDALREKRSIFCESSEQSECKFCAIQWDLRLAQIVYTTKRNIEPRITSIAFDGFDLNKKSISFARVIFI